jgi:hypothetical protein
MASDEDQWTPYGNDPGDILGPVQPMVWNEHACMEMLFRPVQPTPTKRSCGGLLNQYPTIEEEWPTKQSTTTSVRTRTILSTDVERVCRPKKRPEKTERPERPERHERHEMLVEQTELLDVHRPISCVTMSCHTRDEIPDAVVPSINVSFQPGVFQETVDVDTASLVRKAAGSVYVNADKPRKKRLKRHRPNASAIQCYVRTPVKPK